MFQLKITETALFCKAFDTIKDLAACINISLDENGMNVSSIDDSQVCLILLNMKTQFFSEYSLKQNCTVGINTLSFLKILKCLDSKKEWTISYDKDCLDIQSGDKFFSLTLMNIETDAFEIPDMEYDTCVTLDTKEVISCIKDLQLAESDSIKINFQNVDNKRYMVWETISDICKSKHNWLIEDEDLIKKFKELKIKNNPLTYGINFFTKFAKEVLPQMTFKLSREFPLNVNFSNENISLDFYLAPKVNEEMEE